MKLVYCSANIYLLVYISHFLPIISRRHLKHTADKCTCAWEFKKPFIFCFITLRHIQAKINEQLYYYYFQFFLTKESLSRPPNVKVTMDREQSGNLFLFVAIIGKTLTRNCTVIYYIYIIFSRFLGSLKIRASISCQWLLWKQ